MIFSTETIRHFNPFSNHKSLKNVHVINDFKTLSLKQKIMTVAATAFVSLITLFTCTRPYLNLLLGRFKYDTAKRNQIPVLFTNEDVTINHLLPRLDKKDLANLGKAFPGVQNLLLSDRAKIMQINSDQTIKISTLVENEYVYGKARSLSILKVLRNNGNLLTNLYVDYEVTTSELKEFIQLCPKLKILRVAFFNLGLKTFNVADEVLADLVSNLQELETLSLNLVDPSGMTAIANQWLRSPAIKTFHFRFFPNGHTEALPILLNSSNMAKIKDLSFYGCWLHGKEIKLIAESKNLSQVVKLDLTNNHFFDGVDHLIQSQTLTSLKILRFLHPTSNNDLEKLGNTENLPKLKIIQLMSGFTSDDSSLEQALKNTKKKLEIEWFTTRKPFEV